MRALAQPPASGAARLEVWHAGKILDWARTYEEDVRLDLAQAEEDLQKARTRATRSGGDSKRRAQRAHRLR